MRTLSGILFFTAIFAFFATRGFSQTPSSSDIQKKETSASVTPGKFIDKNNNGVCDNFEARNKNGKGANFVDKDGDGKCDNRQNVASGKGNGNCCGKGKGHGYCCGQGNGKGCGQGHQYRHGCQNQKATPSSDQPSGNQKN